MRLAKSVRPRRRWKRKEPRQNPPKTSAPIAISSSASTTSAAARQPCRSETPIAIATGAFSLGRLAFEKRAAYAEAAGWFATYLNEQPHGPLMGDAIGRLMEARDRAGDRQTAQRDAEQYLQRFPIGAYAGTARVILAE